MHKESATIIYLIWPFFASWAINTPIRFVGLVLVWSMFHLFTLLIITYWWSSLLATVWRGIYVACLSSTSHFWMTLAACDMPLFYHYPVCHYFVVHTKLIHWAVSNKSNCQNYNRGQKLNLSVNANRHLYLRKHHCNLTLMSMLTEISFSKAPIANWITILVILIDDQSMG